MAMTIATTLAAQTSLAQTSGEASPAPKRYSLENSVGGGREMGAYYPYSLSSWATRSGDDILYYTPEWSLVASHADGSADTISSYTKLQALAGGGYVRIVEAVSASRLWVSNGAELFLVDTQKNAVEKTIAGPFDDFSVAPASGFVAYTDGANLYVADGAMKTRINKGGEPGVLYGNTVHRNEFGIGGGMFWSPDGQQLCFYRKDESMVKNYPLVDVNERIGSVVDTRYPMAGETSEQVSVGVYDLKSGKTIYLKTASPVNRYFTNISWSPDGSKIAIAEVNRDQDHMWFNIYNARTGRLVKTLFEEANEHWVEPCEPALWVDNQRFVWASYRDGYRHLYLYDTKGGSPRQLTSGRWCVTAIYGYDNANKRVVLQTNREGYLFRDVCSLTLDGDLTRLSPESGVAVASYLNGGSRLVINTSSASVAKESSLCTTTGSHTVILGRNVDPYSEFVKPEIRLVDLSTADGVYPLTGRMILPPDFDANKKYPVLVYVYGGPHSQLVDGSWLNGASPWMLYFAQEGYIVFTMDNRGTEFRGSDFEQSVHRQLGVHEMEDQMVGVEYLKGLPYVDVNRIGVHGWSFGGFMTISLLTTYPGVFRAGAAGGPVCDWKYYEVMYGERYMDTPEQNPQGYASTSLLGKIGNLDSRLLVIHGAMDSTVVWQHSQQLLNAAIEKGIYIDYSVYPNHPHNVSGHDRTHLMGYIKRYFDDWLMRE